MLASLLKNLKNRFFSEPQTKSLKKYAIAQHVFNSPIIIIIIIITKITCWLVGRSLSSSNYEQL